MEITFQVEESDLIALAEFRIEKTGAAAKLIRKSRIWYVIAFGLIALGSWLINRELALWLCFSFLAVLFFFITPSVTRGIMNRSIRRTVRSQSGKTSLGTITMGVSREGFFYHTTGFQSVLQWDLLECFDETEDYVFIAVDGNYSYVIPKREVDPETLAQFLDEIHSRINPELISRISGNEC